MVAAAFISTWLALGGFGGHLLNYPRDDRRTKVERIVLGAFTGPIIWAVVALERAFPD